MPLPVVAVPAAAGPAAAGAAAAFAAAGKHMMLHAAAHAAPFMDITTLSYSIIGYYLLKYIWKNKVPEWAKEDVTFRNLLQSKKKKSKKKTKGKGDATEEEDEEEEEVVDNEKEEMANMASILEKLQALIKSVQIDNDHPSMLQQYAALLAYVQLCGQVKRLEKRQRQQKQPSTTTTKDVNNVGDAKQTQEGQEEEKKEGNEDQEGAEEEEEYWTCRDSLYEKSAFVPTTTAEEEGTTTESTSSSTSFNDNSNNKRKPQELLERQQQALRFATYAYYDDPTPLSDRLEHDEDCYLLAHSLNANKPGVSCYYVAVSSRGSGINGSDGNGIDGSGNSIGTKQQGEQQQQQEQDRPLSQQPQQQRQQRPRLIVGIRGTSTIEDIVTDCCGRSVPFDDRSYYYDDEDGKSSSNKRRGGRRTKMNQSTTSKTSESIEVQAERPQQIIHQEHHDESHYHNQEGEEGVEIIRGETEQIWIDDDYPRNDEEQQDDDYANHQNQIRLNHSIYCHEGIMVSAKRLVDAIQHHVEYWVIQRGYKLIIAGHSLGAGCAALVGVMLRSRLPELQNLITTQQQNDDDGDNSKMHVYCFAPPPVLDRDTALRAKSYCTSIVNNADLIPRCSTENLLILLQMLNGVWKTLQAQGLAPVGPKTCVKFFQKISKGTTTTTTTTTGGGEGGGGGGGDGRGDSDDKNDSDNDDQNNNDMIMTASALRKLMAKAKKKVQQQQQALQQIVKDRQQESEHRQYYRNNKSSSIIKPPLTTNSSESPPSLLEGEVETADANDDPSSSLQSDDCNNQHHHHPNLYIPGVVLIGYEPWNKNDGNHKDFEDDDAGGGGAKAAAAMEEEPSEEHQKQQDQQRSESLLKSFSSDSINNMRKQKMKWITTDGTSDVLRFLEMDASSRMFFDHTTTSYYDLLEMEYQF